MSETPYAETELVLAVMNEDDERARQLVEDMSPGERERLSGQLGRVDDYLHHVCAACGRYVPPNPRPEKSWEHPAPGPEDRIMATLNALSPDRESKTWHRRCAPEEFRGLAV